MKCGFCKEPKQCLTTLKQYTIITRTFALILFFFGREKMRCLVHLQKLDHMAVYYEIARDNHQILL